MVFNLKSRATYQKLLDHLRNNNISLRSVSRLCGFSPALLSQMIHGNRTFLEKHKLTIIDCLDVNRDMLFDD